MERDEPVGVTEGAGLESAAAPSAPTRLAGLDGVRGLAALAVVMTHIGFQTGEGISGPARTVLSRLDIGVAVFFVLSGFLLHRPQVLAAMSGRRLPAVRPYLWRRALRVLPAYWLAVAAAMLLVPENASRPATEWLWQLSLTSIYADGHQLTAFTQAWSLCTEVSFYLVLPLLGRLVARGASGVRPVLRRQLVLSGAMIALGVGLHVLVAADVLLPPHAGYWLPAHADWFGLGMAVAALSSASALEPGWWRRVDELADDAGTCWAAGAALFVIAGTPLTGPYELALLTPVEEVSRTVLYGLVSVLVLLPVSMGTGRPSLIRLAMASRPMQELGRLSYGVFLFHLVVLSIVLDLLDVAPFTGRLPLVTAVVVPCSLLIAWASLRVIEEPAQRLRSRGPGRPRPATTR